MSLVASAYARLSERVAAARGRLGRPLTLAEKVLYGHLADPSDGSTTAEPVRGESYVELLPDRVAMQDATAQMALLQFMTAGLPQVRVPTTVHCDHLIQAKVGATVDLGVAEEANKEVYDFLRTVSARYGIGFWQPGSGIIHQVVLEKYAFPGGLMIGTDSHTPNAGGLGMVAIGVGGADAVDVMTGGTFGLRWPSMIGVRLTGSMSGWTSPKDVILRVAQILTVSGGTGAIVEYFGRRRRRQRHRQGHHLQHGRRDRRHHVGVPVRRAVRHLPRRHRQGRRGRRRPSRSRRPPGRRRRRRRPPRLLRQGRRDRPHHPRAPRCRPQTPDLARGVSALGAEAKAAGWPLRLSQALVGSCTNSSYEDISRAASLARQASAAGLKAKTPLLITPGSEQVRATVERDGLLHDLEAIGANVLANACGPCIGQWARSDVADGQTNSIITSFNRNFPRRNDGNASTLAFVASPETTIAYALAGTLDFNPLTDEIDGVRLKEPIGDELPAGGFVAGVDGYVPPPAEGGGVDVVIDPKSSRLQRLEPFPPWDGNDFVGLRVLLKAVGKCTTDHISAAGRWLRYRGHLENISGNLFLGAVNAFTDEPGMGVCGIHGVSEPLPEVARHYRDAGEGWVAVGDSNYGEGSSREHAAMEPRFMGGKAIMVRSFARIAETNLKKQGVLALVFADPATYDLIGADDRISVLGLADLAPDVEVSCRIERPDGSSVPFLCTHSLSEEHIEWFRAGSALNLIRLRFSPSPSEA